jgi:hypothetical protein
MNLAKFFRMMVARNGVEPADASLFSTLSCILNDLTDFSWPLIYLRSRDRHANRGLESRVQNRRGKGPTAIEHSAVLALQRKSPSISEPSIGTLLPKKMATAVEQNA